MKKKKTKILIIEKSDIIRQGLLGLLTNKNNTPISIDQCNGEEETQVTMQRSSPKILIASPLVFEQNEKKINAYKEKNKILLVALVYSFQSPDSVKHYDAVLYLNDSSKKIQSTIDKLLQNQGNTHIANQNEPLTEREKEILKLLVNGNTTKQIANTLSISTHTVNAHRKNIMRKLDIKTVSGLTIYAVLNNIISLKEV